MVINIQIWHEGFWLNCVVYLFIFFYTFHSFPYMAFFVSSFCFLLLIAFHEPCENYKTKIISICCIYLYILFLCIFIFLFLLVTIQECHVCTEFKAFKWMDGVKCWYRIEILAWIERKTPIPTSRENIRGFHFIWKNLIWFVVGSCISVQLKPHSWVSGCPAAWLNDRIPI